MVLRDRARPTRTADGTAGGRRALLRRVPAWTVPVLALLVPALVAVAALLPLRGPEAAGPDAPANEFSASRARADIEQIARQPRPTGSAANDQVRAYLVDRLRQSGLRPEVQDATAALSFTDHAAIAGRVHNIRATVPGRGGDLRVLVVAHYDSVVLGPGATDDGMGVATVLELARVLGSGEAPRNTVELLLTDAEEPGSIGAKAYVESSAAGDPQRTVVLNLEARGTRGRVVMFETGRGNGAFLGALSGHTPFATSVSDEIYKLLPNDTDFTVFRAAGFTGMNFAVVGDSARYDTELDDLAHQQPDVLQDMGSTVLSASRALAGRDTAKTGSEQVYFTVAGLLVRYPAPWGTVVAILALIAVAAAIVVTRPRGTGLAAATVPVPLIVSAALSWAAWQVLVLVRPHDATFLFGDPYRPGPAVAGMVLLTVVSCLAWAMFLRRHRRDAAAVGAAVLGWFAALAVLTAFLLPGASYLFAWPALIGAAGLVAAGRTAPESRARPLLAAMGALPAILLLAPLAAILFPTVGLAVAPAPVVLVALLVLTAVPAVRVPVPALLAAALTGMVLIGLGAALDPADARHPAQVGLYYVRDVDSGQDSWMSDTDADREWVLRQVSEPRASVERDFPILNRPGGYRRGPASGGAPPEPRAEVLAERRDGDVREIRLRVGADRPNATAISVYADQSRIAVAEATVDDRPIDGGVNRVTPTVWTWGMHFVAPGDGFDLTLRVRGDGPVTLRLVAYDGDVPKNALASPRPDDIAWTAGGFGQSLAARTVRL